MTLNVLNVLRTKDSWWAESDGWAVPVATDATTTAQLLAARAAVETAAKAVGSLGHAAPGAIRASELDLCSPVTAPCRVVAQMVNYASHARDSGFEPAKVPPTFFRKASSSITGPSDDVIRPAHVRFLDYEVELGLVMGRDLPLGATVTQENLHEYVAGLVVTNDVSARDVQLTKGQFYESKSYPTFTPIGPRLVLLDAAGLARLIDLRLQLEVNGVLRQDRTVADMMVKPAEGLTLLARFQSLAAGDVLLTGTPGGTALKAPPKVVEKVGALLPPHLKWSIFFRRQAGNPHYLSDGDVVTAQIGTRDGAIDLGTQRNTVRWTGTR
jgi:2-keto-4-pentenoate hydratase/2-oxohepta-3-ene-1,7-dioic acid hydratase in catechol pathway